MAEKEGFSLEYLNDLTFKDDDFWYRGQGYRYGEIEHIKYTATATKHSVNYIPTGTTYETYLSLILANGSHIQIQQENSFLRGKQQERAEAVMKASSIFHEMTFTLRIENYEKQLGEKGYISWSDYQISKNGDLFKKHEFLFNLKDEKVQKSLHVFAFETGKKSEGFKEKIIKIWKSNEVIDISTDRDCFLYFMKHYLGYSWQNETVKNKRKPNKQEFYEAVLFLGAKICKADGRVSSEEIKTFKTYFGIDENSHPGSAKIFSDAVSSTQGIKESAQKVYNLFNGKKEPLEYIVIGLLQIAATDGVITDEEKNIVEAVCREFHFPPRDIERLFLIYEKIREERRSSKNYASKNSYIEYLKILGLDSNASFDEIKTAYRELAKKHHPDLLLAQGVPIERVRDSEEVLKTINSAYRWLSDYYQEPKRASA